MRSKIFILSHSHSGSTLLDLMIGSHPQCSSLGEFVHFSEKVTSDKPMCVVCNSDCEVWQKFIHIHKKRSPFDAAFDAFGSSYLVDSSKRISWAQKYGTKNDFYIHIVRYGLATLLKTKRKSGKIIPKNVNGWIKSNRNISKFVSHSKHGIRVRYEDLVTSTVEELSRICKFIGIEYYDKMREFWKVKHHVIGGNSKPISAVRIFHNLVDFDDLHHDVQDFLRRSEKPIQLDERYKERFSDKERKMFEKLASKDVRKYGY